MKKIIIIILSLALLISFTACDEAIGDGTETGASTGATPNETTDGAVETGAPEADDSSSETTATVETPEGFDYMKNDLSEFITLGQYEGLTVTITVETLTDEEYAEQVEMLLSEYAYTPFITEDRPAQMGDNISADYSGYMNGELVPNTTATNTVITIAENSGYIPGFVEGYIGHKVGEDFSFDVTFPEDYGNADLAGKLVTFKGKIHGIYDGTEPIAPSLEEFVTEFTDFTSVEEFHENFRTSLDQQLYNQSLAQVHDLLWQQIVEGSTYHSLPKEEVERIFNMNKATYEQYAEMYGVEYEVFLSDYLGADEEQLYMVCETYVKEDLALYQLAKELNVEITETEFIDGCTLYAASYGMTVDQFLSTYDEDTVRLSLLFDKAIAIVADSAEVIEN